MIDHQRPTVEGLGAQEEGVSADNVSNFERNRLLMRKGSGLYDSWCLFQGADENVRQFEPQRAVLTRKRGGFGLARGQRLAYLMRRT